MSFVAEDFLINVLRAGRVTRNGDELIHACLLPSGGHENDHKAPGASLNAEKLLYNCFKCGSGGTLLWATQEILDVTSAQARKLIEGTFKDGDKAPERFLMDLENAWLNDGSAAMPRYNVRMLDAWKAYTKYMDERGITRDVQKEMKTGIKLDNLDWIGEAQIVQPRVVIPHIFGGILRGWTMRLISDRQVGDKYKHTSQFPKMSTLYNYDSVKRQFDSVIFVESPMSALKLKSLGIHNVVATFGAQLNPEQEKLLMKFDEVIAFPDGDKAGYRSLSSYDKLGNIVGTAHRVGAKTRLWIVDHGWDGDKFNDKDPADYSREEVMGLLSNKIDSTRWRYVYDGRKKNANTKVRPLQVGPSSGDWD